MRVDMLHKENKEDAGCFTSKNAPWHLLEVCGSSAENNNREFGTDLMPHLSRSYFPVLLQFLLKFLPVKNYKKT
jgi:hypothetical protein